jgi:hypothetical protein
MAVPDSVQGFMTQMQNLDGVIVTGLIIQAFLLQPRLNC